MCMSKLKDRSVGEVRTVDTPPLQIRPIARARVLEKPPAVDPAHRRVARGHARVRHLEDQARPARRSLPRGPALGPPTKEDLVDVVEAMPGRARQGSIALEDDVQVVMARRAPAVRGKVLERVVVVSRPRHASYNTTFVVTRRPCLLSGRVACTKGDDGETVLSQTLWQKRTCHDRETLIAPAFRPHSAHSARIPPVTSDRRFQSRPRPGPGTRCRP